MRCRPAPPRPETPSADLPPRLRKGLALLLEAFDYACRLRRPVWDFAVEIQDLRAAGLSASDLRGLLCRAYAEHAVEQTRPCAPWRSFRPVSNLALTERSCFVLTGAGAAHARQAGCLPPGPGTTSPDVPKWDDARRELSWRDQLVKQFKQPAPRQETILTAFEEEGWPPHIDDPLPPQPGQDPKRHLHDTINNLNRHHKSLVLYFRGDGRGRGVCWQLLG